MKINHIIKIILLILLVSCNSKNETKIAIDKKLSKFINERYKTNDLSFEKGIDINLNGKTKKFIHFTLKNGNKITASEIDRVTSEIALIIFNSLDKKEQNETDEFRITISQNGQNNAINYKNSTIQKVIHSITFLESFFELIKNKKYQNAKEKFNTEIVDTSKIDLELTHNKITSVYGQLKNIQCQSFEIGETGFKGKKINLLKLYCLSIYEKGNLESTFTTQIDFNYFKILHFKIN